MLIVCPTCATAYDIKPASLEPDGRQVRCVRCRTVWRAAPSRADRLAAAAAALAPGPAADEPTAVPAARQQAMPAVASTDSGDVQWTDYTEDTQPANAQSFETPSDGLSQLSAPGDPTAQSGPVEVKGPPIAPVDLDAEQPAILPAADYDAETAEPPHEDIETLAARRFGRRAERRQFRWPMTALQNAILALIIIDCVLIGWRKDVVRILPQTASLYALMGLPVNLRGLIFDSVVTSTEEHEGVPILVVEGVIVNQTGNIVDVPRLKLAVRNGVRQEIYSWTAVPPRASLAPGEAVAFRTRLASPPPDSHDVIVRFVNRRDIVAEGH